MLCTESLFSRLSCNLTHVRRRRREGRLLKRCLYILLLNFAFGWIYSVCLSVFKLVPAENAQNAFNLKSKYEKLDFVVHALQTAQNLVIKRRCFPCRGRQRNGTKNFNGRGQSLFCLLSLLFGDVPFAVAVVSVLRKIRCISQSPKSSQTEMTPLTWCRRHN